MQYYLYGHKVKWYGGKNRICIFVVLWILKKLAIDNPKKYNNVFIFIFIVEMQQGITHKSKNYYYWIFDKKHFLQCLDLFFVLKMQIFFYKNFLRFFIIQLS